jgi:DNA phosphorothioation-dependent restriction protein DptH
MTQQLLPRAIAHVVASRNGLTAVYLPEGIASDFAHKLVAEANKARPTLNEPFALVVADPDSPNEHGSEVTAADLVRYRVGNRLAVASGRVPELSSLTTSFSVVLNQSFPEPSGASGEAGELLKSVARELLSVVLVESGARDRPNIDEDALALMFSVLDQLRQIHRENGHGLLSWNQRWFAHVEMGSAQLANVISHFVAEESPRSLLSILTENMYASFGLPAPTNGRALDGEPRLGAQVKEAHDLWWGTTERARETLNILERQTGAPHPIADCNWELLDRERATTDDAALGWARVASASVEHTRMLAKLTEAQFRNPAYDKSAPPQLRVFDEHWRALDNEIAPLSLGVLSDEANVIALKIELPTAEFAHLDIVNSSRVHLRASKGFAWEGSLRASAEHGIFIEGSLTADSSIETPCVVRLELLIPSEDTLQGSVLPADGTRILVFPGVGTSVVAFELRAAGQVLPKEITTNLKEVEPSLELPSPRGKYRLLVRSEPGLQASLDGRSIPETRGNTLLFSTDFTPQERNSLKIGDFDVAITSPRSDTVQISPILAAITRDAPSPDSMSDSESGSLRGRYEEAATASFGDEGRWRRSLGQMAVSVDEDSDFVDLQEHAGVVMSSATSARWTEVLDFSVPQSLLESAQAKKFRAAFEALDLFGRRAEPDLPEQLRFPSRYPRRDLWHSKRIELDAYLDAYSELVDFARAQSDESALFWASYPFSLSIWSLDPNDSGCKAVLLSPLHPLRLAWQAAAEAALWESSDASQLAGTIQGYGFPLSGPNEHTPVGMIAVQSDTGADQVFLGWSVLVTSSSEKFQSLSMPSHAGGVETPGTAASGLNASAVDAALKTYRRINPHVSTLTIDLASKSASPRLIEVDNAIVSVLEGWSKNPIDALPGGARILDSSNRKGALPLDLATTLVRSHPGLPLSWSRYEHIEGKAQRANIRILEDAGLRVRVKSDPSKVSNGVIGSVPLRRYDTSSTQMGQSEAVDSSPAVNDSSRWRAFSVALQSVENGPQISSKLLGTLLADDSADWTVSGESMLSPTALSKLLQKATGQRMLWEWRPPLFSPTGNSLEQKPYLSVARVPPSFQDQLKEMLSKAMNRDADHSDVETLLETLGSRGVGLSSLLAMGGTQASGALGFYLAFRLLDKTVSRKGSRFVLPIDACDSFLRALAGRAHHADGRRRADLLVVDIDESGIVLTPLEIKFYGFGAEAPLGTLPNLNSAALGEPLTQLDATAKLLRAIVEKQAEVKAKNSPLEMALWSNGLAALMDAAANLDPREQDGALWGADLAAVIQGERTLRMGAPLVLFFNFLAEFPGGKKFETFASEDGYKTISRFGALVASSEIVFEAVDADSSTLVSHWRDLLSWAITDSVSADSAEPSALTPKEPQADELEPNSSKSVEQDVVSEEPDAEVPEAPKVPSVSTPSTPSVRDLKEPESISSGVVFPIGDSLESVGDASAYFWPSNTALNQLNIGVVGDLGTGKTQLLKSLVFRLRHQASIAQSTPISMLIFDYKSDYQDEKFLRAVGGRVLRPERIPLNVFALSGEFSPLKAVQRARMFVDVIAKIYGGVGPVQRTQLLKAVVESYGSGGAAPTIGVVLERYKELSPKPDSVSSILEDFVMAQIFSEDPSELLTFEDLMNDRVLVVALSDLGVDQSGKNALVVLFLNMYYDYMLRAHKWPYVGTDPQLRTLNSFLLVDEATNIMEYEFPVLMQLLLQGREFGFGTILASQYLTHFRTSKVNYGEPLLTWFIHKVPSVSAKELQQLGIVTGMFGAESRISQLAVHEAYYASFGYPGGFVRGAPFFEVLGASEGDEDDEGDAEQ